MYYCLEQGYKCRVDDVNKDGETEITRRFFNPATGGIEKKIIDIEDKSIVFKKYQVIEGKINYLD